MTHIRYAGVIYKLPAVSGAFLCDAIETALLRGDTFFVELGTSHEFPDMQQSILLSPATPVELARPNLDGGDAYRDDIVDALIELAELPAKRMYWIPNDWDRDEVARFMDKIRASVADLIPSPAKDASGPGA